MFSRGKQLFNTAKKTRTDYCNEFTSLILFLLLCLSMLLFTKMQFIPSLLDAFYLICRLAGA